jgi:hypothetical protein
MCLLNFKITEVLFRSCFIDTNLMVLYTCFVALECKFAIASLHLCA